MPWKSSCGGGCLCGYYIGAYWLVGIPNQSVIPDGIADASGGQCMMPPISLQPQDHKQSLRAIPGDHIAIGMPVIPWSWRYLRKDEGIQIK